MILITGPTGRIGSAVHRKMILMGRSCRVLLRDPKKAKLVPSTNTQTVIGDFERPATLSLAFQGVKRLLLVSEPSPKMNQLHQNVIQAAKKAGVAHIVRVSALGASPSSPVELLKLHAQGEKDLEGAGISFTHLRPSFFFQNFDGFFQTILEEKTFYAPLKNAPVSMIDVRDIGNVAVAALTEDGHEGKTYELTGPHPVTFPEAAQALTSLWSRTVKYVDVPPAVAKASMVDRGTPDWLAANVIDLFLFMATGKYNAVTPTVQKITKMPPRDFKMFAEEFVKKLKETESARLGRVSR